jgi:hypothetical protein
MRITGRLESDMEQWNELFLTVMCETERKRVISALEEAEGWYELIKTGFVPLRVSRIRMLKAATYDYEVRCQVLRARRSALEALNAALIRVYTDLTGKWGSKIEGIPADRVKQLWERYSKVKEWSPNFPSICSFLT